MPSETIMSKREIRKISREIRKIRSTLQEIEKSSSSRHIRDAYGMGYKLISNSGNLSVLGIYGSDGYPKLSVTIDSNKYYGQSEGTVQLSVENMAGLLSLRDIKKTMGPVPSKIKYGLVIADVETKNVKKVLKNLMQLYKKVVP